MALVGINGTLVFRRQSKEVELAKQTHGDKKKNKKNKEDGGMLYWSSEEKSKRGVRGL